MHIVMLEAHGCLSRVKAWFKNDITPLTAKFHDNVGHSIVSSRELFEYVDHFLRNMNYQYRPT